jgi:streptomycin 6-kinase
MMALSDDFTRRILNTFGEDGRRWLESLPSILEELSSTWDVKLMPPFSEMSFNYVAPAVLRDGSEVVLKVGVPRTELVTEIAALKAFNGNGAVGLYKADPKMGALLLERLRPGMSLYNVGDDEFATKAACEVICKLCTSSLEHDVFPTVGDWFRGFQRLRDEFNGETGPFPNHLVDEAEVISRDLLASMDAPILLHGDLHHWNILSSEREPWLAIDPKGVIGESEYETGAWVRNPFPNILEMSNPDRMIARRLDQFSIELGFDRERIYGWGFSQAVLSAYWSYEDKDEDWENGLAVAEVIKNSMRN